MDRNGEPVYKLTPKCEEVFPELYALHKADINEVANELWQLGVLDIVFRYDTNAVLFTVNNYKKLQEVHETLTPEQIDFLEVVIEAPIGSIIEEKHK